MASKTLTIEIGNEFIKICESELKKNSITVHSAVSVQTPEESVEDGFIRNDTLVSQTIKQAMSQESISAKEVVFVLSSSRIASKEVVLPYVKKKEKIQEMINANASDYFPIDINEYVFSYTILEEIKTKEEEKIRVLVYAAPSLMVEGYFELAATLGMKVKAVDYSGNSTLQLIKIQIDKKPTLVVQLGMDTTIASVMVDDVLRLQRTIPYGESLLLQSVTESRKVSSKVALELLSQVQIVKDSLDKDETTGSLKYLINNVNRVIEYYSSRNADTPLEKIVIIGEGADVMGMDVLFNNETGLPSERLTILKNVEPYNRMKISNSVLRNYMANFGASIDPIHFEPKRMAAAAQESKGESGTPFIIVGVVALAAAAALAIIPMVRLNNKEKTLEDLKTQISKKEYIEDVYAENEESTKMRDSMELYDLGTHSNTEYTPEVIDYLETIIPKDMKISSFNVEEGVVSMQVICTDKTQLAGFLEDLGNNSFLYTEDEEIVHIMHVTSDGYSEDTPEDDEDSENTVSRVTANVSFRVLSNDYLKLWLKEYEVVGFAHKSTKESVEEAIKNDTMTTNDATSDSKDSKSEDKDDDKDSSDSKSEDKSDDSDSSDSSSESSSSSSEKTTEKEAN